MIETQTTTGNSQGVYNKCLYCGNYHSYSAEMCRDMTTTKQMAFIEPKVNMTLCPSAWQHLPYEINWVPLQPTIKCYFCGNDEIDVIIIGSFTNKTTLLWKCTCEEYKKAINQEEEKG
jgi:hypothetical protein